MIRFGTTGIRGVVHKTLPITLAPVVGLAASIYFRKGTVAVGHDARVHSIALYHGLISGILSGGSDVIALDYAPTPTVQYFVKKEKLAGGLVVTASHNPPEYNGFKFVERDGRDLSKSSERYIERVINNILEEGYTSHRADFGDVYESDEAIMIHINGIIDDLSEVVEEDGLSLKVVVDPSNSVSVLVTPRVLQLRGAKVITINGDLNGLFPGHPPEPVPENLEGLKRAVVAFNADFGVAHDGDGDRAVFVDELGNVYHGDDSLALIVSYLLPRVKSKKVVVSISTSNVVKDVVENLGGELYRAPVGARKVCDKMAEVGAEIGGEESGGIMFSRHGYFRDGPFAAYLFASMLEESGKKASELFSSLPKYYRVKLKVLCPDEIKEKVMEEIIPERIDKGVEAVTIDGIRVRFEDGSWVLIRPSGTEPIIRIFSESKDPKRAEKLAEVARTSVVEKVSKYRDLHQRAIRKVYRDEPPGSGIYVHHFFFRLRLSSPPIY